MIIKQTQRILGYRLNKIKILKKQQQKKIDTNIKAQYTSVGFELPLNTVNPSIL